MTGIIHRATRNGKESFAFSLCGRVARREYSGDMESVIDLFLQRGEDTNSQCGPFGSALHGWLEVGLGYKDYRSEVLRMLVRKGANVNAEGPMGKPLEYLWMLA